MPSPVPPEVAASQFREDDEVVPTRDAATVVLLRDAGGGTDPEAEPAGHGPHATDGAPAGDGPHATDGAPAGHGPHATDGGDGRGVEVYLLVRTATMAAFAGMTVFPGGRVDPADVEAQAVPWHGPSPADWPLSADPRLSRALVCAAVRETFEESGVLLAGPTAGTVVADTGTDEWEASRRALESRATSLSALLTERGLLLRADLLRPWAHWITPVEEPRRYDTRFFVAALPAGQHTRDVTGESDRALWMRPADALAARDRGELSLLPPTATTLRELVGFATVADVLDAAASREIRPILPRLVQPTADGDPAAGDVGDGSDGGARGDDGGSADRDAFLPSGARALLPRDDGAAP